MDPEQKNYKEERLNSLTDAYPHKFSITINFEDFINNYQNTIEPGERNKDICHRLAGRIREKRTSGKNLIFYRVDSNGHTVQFIMDKKEAVDANTFKTLNDKIHRGDIVGVTGFIGKSRRGELSLFGTEIQLLTPCLYMLPKQHFGLTDPEQRIRKRYLDMIVNPSVANVFRKRSMIFQTIRKFMESNNFVEVQTPILGNLAGGASAKPFITYHNDMKQEMYLRVAPELYLKQLVVGGMDRVFEIGPQFRNESCDKTHNPEFYSMEFYMAYADYYDLITMAERLLTSVISFVNSSMTVEYLPMNADTPLSIDFTSPYPRYDICEELSKEGIEIPDDFFSQEAQEYLSRVCVERSIDCSEPRTTARLLDKLISHYIEPKCINPSFIINHPLIMSPLAKPHRENPQMSERFELFVGGVELANAYTELNIPSIQREMFEKQMDQKKAGDDEAQPIDETFIEALEYGLPPTGGFGLGIDRLVMFLTNCNSIREVIAFPAVHHNT